MERVVNNLDSLMKQNEHKLWHALDSVDPDADLEDQRKAQDPRPTKN